ncbi:PAT1 family protein [Granulibacter bethesdensis]|uniref:hypothetical protein n=1 Tax=Granulibacter bethesdensis TaxID=364410 RepID=UPI00090CCED7|nr:hypothetical protein [Granulibacter bethesdensis]APH58489.1 Hypothetical protein GbCGDNIH7_0197 [Granulibacter bethesdensis]
MSEGLFAGQNPAQSRLGQGAPGNVAAPSGADQQAAAQNTASRIMSEIQVSAHVMKLDPGLFCFVQTPSPNRPLDNSGLPAIRVSLPPGHEHRPHAISVTSFREDGWLYGPADAALVRVMQPQAQVLVTIYQQPGQQDSAPRLQVLRLADGVPFGGVPSAPPLQPGFMQPGAVPPPGVMPQVGVPPMPPPQGVPQGIPQGMQQGAPHGPAQSFEPVRTQSGAIPDIIAHIRMQGDVGDQLGEWIGERGSTRWIEGFMIMPQGLIDPKDIEYQGVLGRGWLSPWMEGGQLCGSRGMALPLLGLKARLRNRAAEAFDLSYEGSFVDGTAIGPLAGGETLEATNMAPLEAFRIILRPKAKATVPKSAPKASTRKAASSARTGARRNV